MSDSEDDLLSNVAYNYQNDLKSIYVQGPNNSGFYYPNNFLSSTRNMLQQSECIGSRASTVSMRSLDSNVSAAEIASVIKNANFNQNDIRLIKEAFNKYLKSRSRRRIEKRRNRKLFSKNTRLQYGVDSGDQGSDSSLSSDECSSTRTASYKENLTKYKTNNRIMNQQTTINENNLYKDCTDNFRQCYTRNMLSVNHIHSSTVINSKSAGLLKDRFNKGYPYPAKRFNNYPQSSTEPKSSRAKCRLTLNEDKQMMNNLCFDSNSESQQEEMFSEITTIERTFENSKTTHKRHNDLNEVPKTQLQIGLDRKTDSDNNCKNNFVFAKPQLPVKGTCKVKRKISNPNILISNCHQHLNDAGELSNRTVTQKKIQSSHTSTKIMENNDRFKKKPGVKNETMKENHSNDVSMRPSFIKRKLFTQKLDIAENRNLCNTSQNNSPHIKKPANNNIKEKNKTRKIASSQSCLSRDVLVEDNHIKDLIQKIVPSDGILATNAANHSQASYSNCQLNDSDKWDVTSVISTCNKNEFSDTYTDEEIFNPIKVANKYNNNTNKVQSKLDSNCSIILEKLPQNAMITTKAINSTMEQNVINRVRKVDVKKKPSLQQKSFWDTELESDFDNNDSLPRNLNGKKIKIVGDKIEDGTGSTNIIKNSKKTDKVEVNLTTSQNRPKRTATIKTTQANIEGANSKIAEKRSKTSQGKKKDSPNSNQNISKTSNRNLRSTSCTRNLDNDEKFHEHFGTVSLINHRVLRSKRIEKRNLLNNSTPCGTKSLDVSNDLNISIKSLRSWHNKENK